MLKLRVLLNGRLWKPYRMLLLDTIMNNITLSTRAPQARTEEIIDISIVDHQLLCSLLLRLLLQWRHSARSSPLLNEGSGIRRAIY